MLKRTRHHLFLILGLVFLVSTIARAGESDLKACLKKAIAKENPIYQVSEDLDKHGKYSRYLALVCEGEVAKELYLSIKGQAFPGEWSGKTQGNLKYLGETGGVSFCYHIMRDSQGDATDKYNCSIRLSISSDILGKTSLEGINAYPVK